MDKLGLVFSGGGAKGSYEVGVWKALDELGLTERITGVSGSSIGAFNTALFLQNDQKHAEEVWRNATKMDFMNLNIPKIIDKIIADYESPKDALLTNINLVDTGIRAIDVLSDSIESRLSGENRPNDNLKNYAIWAAQNLFGDGFATPDRLIQILKDNVDFGTLSDRNMDLYSTICRWDVENEICGTAEYISWQGLSQDQILTLIATSMALPVLYPHGGGEEEHYVDGGYADNTPIQPLYDSGYREFIVIYLDSYPGKKRKTRIQLEQDQFPDASFYRLFPNDAFDASFSKACSISAKQTEDNLSYGYEDTMYYFTKGIYDEDKTKAELKAEAKAEKLQLKEEKKLEKQTLKTEKKAEKLQRKEDKKSARQEKRRK